MLEVNQIANQMFSSIDLTRAQARRFRPEHFALVPADFSWYRGQPAGGEFLNMLCSGGTTDFTKMNQTCQFGFRTPVEQPLAGLDSDPIEAHRLLFTCVADNY
jgi:hypothetical protein